ncbi:hypothetical protein KUF71_008227, partial [Frankliniella fusca]
MDDYQLLHDRCPRWYCVSCQHKLKTAGTSSHLANLQLKMAVAGPGEKMKPYWEHEGESRRSLQNALTVCTIKLLNSVFHIKTNFALQLKGWRENMENFCGSKPPEGGCGSRQAQGFYPLWQPTASVFHGNRRFADCDPIAQFDRFDPRTTIGLPLEVAFRTNDWAPPDRMTGQWEVEARQDDRGGEKQKEKFLRKSKRTLGVEFKPPISTELPRGIADGLVVLVPRKPRGVMRLGTWGLGSIPSLVLPFP